MSSTASPCVCENAAIIRIWQCLPRLRRLRLVAEPGAQSATGWRGHGQADITPESIDGDWRLVERGHFRPHDAARGLAFANVYRWRLLADGIGLWHERFGAEAPVFLFDLIAAGDGRLTARDPHRCGADIYGATLTPDADGFALDWTIRGPAKDERLYYHYTLKPTILGKS